MGDLREEFGPLADRYLAHYRRGVLSASALRAANELLQEAHARAGLHVDRWREDMLRARVALGRFIGVRDGARAADEIATFENTTHAIAAVAHGLALRPGDAVVMSRLEYPASVLTWRAAAARHDLDVVMLQAQDAAGRTPVAAFEAVLRAGGPRRPVRIVAVSHVSFCTGLAINVAALARVCHEHGALLIVDMVQSIAALPIDVRSMGISPMAPTRSTDDLPAHDSTAGPECSERHSRDDGGHGKDAHTGCPDFIVGDARKFIGGLDGLGFLWAPRDLHDALHGVAVGLGSIDHGGDALAFDAPLRRGARRHTGGAQSTIAGRAMEAALGVWERFGGAPAIWAAIESTIAAVLGERQNAAPASDDNARVDGVWIPTRGPHERSSIIVAYVPPDSVAERLARVERAGYEIGSGPPLPLPADALAAAGFDRAPARLLFSPHAYTPRTALREAMLLALPELADRLTESGRPAGSTAPHQPPLDTD